MDDLAKEFGIKLEEGKSEPFSNASKSAASKDAPLVIICRVISGFDIGEEPVGVAEDAWRREGSCAAFIDMPTRP